MGDDNRPLDNPQTLPQPLLTDTCLKVCKSTYLVLASVQVFYSSRSGSYNETQGPIGGPRAGKILCNRVVIARSNK
jgi:hypothetical protein